MESEKEIALKQHIQRIVQRATPQEDRQYLEQFLMNLLIQIKKAWGEELTDEERLYPEHPELSHHAFSISQVAGESYERLLEIVDKYEVADVRRIISLTQATSALTPFPEEFKLTRRMIRILRELLQDPLIPKTHLAKRLKITRRTIANDLRILEDYYYLRFLDVIDPHKFKLAHFNINFQTKSVSHSKQLEEVIQSKWPVFLRTITFDDDYRRGWLSYHIPDQPKARKLLEERLGLLNDEYFEYYIVSRIHGFHVYASFDTYDYASGTWLLQPPFIAEALLNFIKENAAIIPPPRGFFYSQPMEFDRIDYLIGQLLAAIRPIGLIQEQLQKYDFNLSKKTIWARILNLRKKEAIYPFVGYDLPAFHDFVALWIKCSEESREFIRLIPSILPFTFIYNVDYGLSLGIYQPVNCSDIGGQILRAVIQEPGVTDVILNRMFTNIGTTTPLDAWNRWEESRQRWILQEGDI